MRSLRSPHSWVYVTRETIYRARNGQICLWWCDCTEFTLDVKAWLFPKHWTISWKYPGFWGTCGTGDQCVQAICQEGWNHAYGRNKNVKQRRGTQSMAVSWLSVSKSWPSSTFGQPLSHFLSDPWPRASSLANENMASESRANSHLSRSFLVNGNL